MQLPIETLAQVVGFAVVVFLIARTRPTPMANGNALNALLGQVTALSGERDELRKELELLRAACAEQQKDINALRRALREAQAAHDFNRGRGAG